MTLDAIEAQLKPILVKFPMARFVLVGVPGAPNTMWPSHWILNPDLQSRAVAKLMKHLHETDRLASYRFPPEHLTRSKEDTEPIFFMGDTISQSMFNMHLIHPYRPTLTHLLCLLFPSYLSHPGFGIGGHTLSRFIDSFLPELPWLQSRIRAILLVNTILKITRPFKKMCMDLRRGMLMGSHPEIHSMFASLHFKVTSTRLSHTFKHTFSCTSSQTLCHIRNFNVGFFIVSLKDDYLLRNGREKVLDLFWSYREGLSLAGVPMEQAGLAFVGTP